MPVVPPSLPLEGESLLAPAIAVGATGVLPDAALSAQVAAAALEGPAIEPEAAYRLLTPAICGRHPELALQWLLDVGLLGLVLPELVATVALSQEGGRRHKDVWEHTKAVVRQAVPRPEVRWAALLHDIGKVPTRRFVGPGKVTFHGHAEEGARMFRRGPALRIAFPAEVAARVEVLIHHHLRPGHYDGSWTDSAVRRFALEMGPFLRDLLDLSRADVTSRRPGRRRRCLAQISALGRRIRAIQAADARVPPLPAGLGKLLMSGLGLPPGRHIGELRDRLEALCEAGELAAGEDPAYYLEAVRVRGLAEALVIVPPRPPRDAGSALAAGSGAA